jgi:hypothetical protein
MEYEETEYELPNNFLVRPGKGPCPNGCKYPQYDNKDCTDEMLEGKAYRKCPWVKDGLNNLDCNKCGAILMPKNKYGYARTRPGLFDNKSVDSAINHSKSSSKSDFYNIGKHFMEQLAYIKHFNLPESINSNEYGSIGKLVHRYQTEKNNSSRTLLTEFINAILTTTSLSKNNKNIDNNNLISGTISASGGNFDFKPNKLSGKAIYAYDQGLAEAESDNRLGGSSSEYKALAFPEQNEHVNKLAKFKGANASSKSNQSAYNQGLTQAESDNRLGGSTREYEKHDTAYTRRYKPRDPRKRPKPYDSIWKIFD